MKPRDGGEMELSVSEQLTLLDELDPVSGALVQLYVVGRQNPLKTACTLEQKK